MPRRTELRRRSGSWAFAMALACVSGGMLSARQAHATPRPLPFTYQSETLSQGSVEVEQFVDLVPVRVQNNLLGQPQWYVATEFQTEFEIGLTDRLELGLYVAFVPQPNAETYGSVPVMEFGNGVRQRLRYRLADPEAWPVDVALYGELSETDTEIEVEGKIILQRRVGPVRLITNLWAEHEFYLSGVREWVLNPTLGATVELTPRYHLGVESWMRAEDQVAGTGPRGWVVKPHVYVGPAFLVNFGRMWWSTGLYWQVTDIDQTLTPGDPYGHFWARTIVGLSF
jgi:hypothetical protein